MKKDSHAAPSACCPPRGRFSSWGGPTMKTTAALLFALMSCHSLSQAQEVPTLRVGWTIPGEEAKYLMAKRPELFPQLGKKYQIQWTQFQGTSPMVQAMRAGVLECSTMAPMSLANGAIESGLEAYIVAQHVHSDDDHFSVYWAVKEDSPIKTAADLKGKVIGTNAYGAGVYFDMLLWLRQNGIDPDKDVKIVETGFPPAADAIRSGRIDAGPMAQPFALLNEKKGGLRKLFSLSEVASPSVQIFEACSKSYSDANPEVVRAYVQDLKTAMGMLSKDPSLAVEVTAQITRAPKDLLAQYLFTDKDFARVPDMQPNLESIQGTYDRYHKAGFLKKALNVQDFYRADLREATP